MILTIEEARKRSAVALEKGKQALEIENEANKKAKRPSRPTLTNLALVGAPGTKKIPTINALVQEKHYAFVHAPSVAARTEREGDPYFFLQEGETFETCSEEILEGTIHSINGVQYGLSFNQIEKILSDGKHFVIVTTVEGAEILEDLLGSEVSLLFFHGTRESRSRHLHVKYDKVEGSQEEIASRLQFGDDQLDRRKASGTRFIDVLQADLQNPFNAAEVIISKIEVRLRQAA